MDDEHGFQPPDLALLIAFLNSVDRETGVDELADPDSCGAWLATNIPSLTRFISSAEDLSNARALRNGLRALARANAGEQIDRAAVAAGTAVLTTLPVRICLVSHGSVLTAGGAGLRHLLAEIGVSYGRSVERGRWPKVKLCASPECRWAYWDGSKNGSRKWCAMRVCGSRAKMRSYRSRAAGAASRPGRLLDDPG